MQQVIIEFAADTSAMAPADKALAGLTEKEKQLADQSIKTATAMNAQGKATTDAASQGTKSVQQLSDSFKQLDKALLGGAYKTTFDTIRKNLNLTDKELKAFYQNIIKNSRAQILDSNTNKADFEALNQLIKSAQSALDAMGKSEDVVGEKSQSMRQRLKELKNDLQQLEDQGKDNSIEFEKMSIEAGKLQDQIGDTNARIQALSSDTFAFDAIASGITGVAGAFSIAQGAAALFGSENEEVQQALLKVNAAMAILQGLQTVQNVLQKQSAASIAIDILLKKNQTAATTAQTLATEAGTVAQKGLNAAFAVSPVGLILIGITALITALTLFGDEEKDVTEQTKELTDAMDKLNEAFKTAQEVKNIELQRPVEILQRQLDLLKAQGASQDIILAKEIEIGKAKLATNDVTRSGKGGLEEYNRELEESKKKIDELTDEFDKLILAGPEALNKGEFDKGVKRLSEAIAKEKDAYNLLKAGLKDYYDTVADLANKEAERRRKELEDRLRSATNEADAEVARRKLVIVQNEVDTIASIEKVGIAERNAIRARLKEELKSNPDLTGGERAKLIADANLAIAENYKDTYNKIFSFKKDSIKADLSAVKEGSKEELNLKLELLTQEQLEELNATEITAGKKREIDNKYFKERLELVRSYNKQVAEDAINIQVAATSSQLSNLQVANVTATNSEIIRLKKEQIDQAAQLEVVSVEYSEKNEELRRVKIKAIYDKALADKRKLEEDKLKTEIENDNTFIQKVYQLAAKQQQAILDSNQSTEEQKKEAVRQINALNEAQSDAEFKQLEELHNNKLISEEEYMNRLLDLKIKKNDEANAILLQQAQIQQQKEQIIRETAFNAANQLVNALAENQQAQYDFELQQAKDLYDQKIISEKEYNNRQKQIKRQAAIAEREAALFNIFLETQQKAMAIQAQRAVYLSNPVTAPLAALASTQLISLYITEAITAGLLAARKLPAFRHGGVDIDGPGTSTSDSILSWLSKGETVTTAEQTRKHKPALQAIHDDSFEDYLKNIALPKYYPSMPTAPVQAVTYNTPDFSFDYKAMAKTISQELAENPMLIVKIDKDGFGTFLQQQSSITEIKNRDFEL